MNPLVLYRYLPHWFSARLLVATLKLHRPLLLVRRYRLIHLVVALAFYVVMKRTDSPPFTPSQLALWFDELPIEIKSALIGAVVAAAGFLFAFNTAVASSRLHQWNLLRLESASILRDKFHSIQDDIGKLRLTLKLVGEGLEGTQQILKWRQEGMHEHVLNFWAAHQRLMNEWVTIHMFAERQRWIVNSVSGANDLLTELVDDFTQFMIELGHPMPPSGETPEDTAGILRRNFDPGRAALSEGEASDLGNGIGAKVSALHYLIANEAINVATNSKSLKTMSLDEAKKVAELLGGKKR